MTQKAKEPDMRSVSKPTLRRLPFYLSYLKREVQAGKDYISATAVAAALGLNEVQVRKDLSSASQKGGRPKTGYHIETLIADLERFLGYHSTKNAVLVGCGRLGGALLSFTGFQECGMHIAAAFDNDPSKLGIDASGKTIYHIQDLPHYCRAEGIRIGIITTRPEQAQTVCDAMIEGGILAIWNFSTAHLETPEHIIVHNEDLAVSLAMISHALDASMQENLGKDDIIC